MIQPIILAAGKGTRMRSLLPKTLHTVAGAPMLKWILEAVKAVPACKPPLIVVGYGADQVRSYVGNEHTCIEQTELTGTASAVKVALPYVPHDADAVLVLYGDQPFVRPESIQAIADIYESKRPHLIQSSLHIEDFKGWREIFTQFGRLLRDHDGSLIKNVEYKNATEEERALCEVNPGICAIDAAWLREVLPHVKANSLTGEYYLTDLISLASKAGKHIVTVELSHQEAMGINSPEDAQRAESFSTTQ